MATLMEMGIGQCLIPPLRRPNISALRQFGFSGKTDAAIVEAAYKTAPNLVAVCYSAASMWTANAATVSPSVDCADDLLHLTPANLNSTLHRSLEGPATARLLNAIFGASDHFTVHSPLGSAVALTDEGAANHTRLCDCHENSGIEIFVYGSSSQSVGPKKFPARQTLAASQAVARLHQLNPDRTLFWQQNPAAIDAGVFHNDVISVGNQNFLLAHEMAFVDQAHCIEDAKRKFAELNDADLCVVEISTKELSVADTVRSYLFNSQLVSRPDGNMTLVCPIECEEIKAAFKCTQRIVDEDNLVDEVKFLNLRQSMNNGGGPACLRLRVVLTEKQQAKIHQGVVLNSDRIEQLRSWVESHYRETLTPTDLADPKLLEETDAAISALAPILDLPIEAWNG